MPNTYQKSLIVTDKHLDDQNHVNNVVYLQWVQEIAKEHWELKTTQEIEDAYFWVVVEHTIKYKDQAYLGDKLDVKTYVDRNEGVRSYRYVNIYREDKLLVETMTTWCLMDKKRNRPTRVPTEISALFGIIEN